MYEIMVTGFCRNAGTYEGHQYDNWVIHGTTAHVNPRLTDPHRLKAPFQGREAIVVKVPARFGYVPRVGDSLELVYGPQGLICVQVKE